MLRPLEGKEILITREESQSKPFADLIVGLGGIPVKIPLLKVTCYSSANNTQIFDHLVDYQWIIFTSANGVDCFFKQTNEQGIKVAKSTATKFAVVGHKTENALHENGASASFLPSVYNAETMAEEFLQQVAFSGPLLIVKGSKSRNVIQESLTQYGVDFDEVVTYKTTSNFESQATLNDYLNKRLPDYLTFTSPSSVEAFIEMNVEPTEQVKEIPCVCIGTTTQAYAIEMGFKQTMVPNQFTIEGIVETITHYIEKKG